MVDIVLRLNIQDWLIVDSLYIKRLIWQGENQQLDFKFEVSDSKKIARSLVAFSNTDGGKLLIGVKDNGSIAGVRSEEEFYMVEAAAKIFSKPEISFITRKWDVDGKTVLEVDIPKSDTIPHLAPGKNGKWLVYIRVGDQNLLANSVLLKLWKRKKRKTGTYITYTEKEKLLLTYLEEHQEISMSKFRKIAKLSNFKAENILINFIALGIIEMVFTEKNVVYKLKSKATVKQQVKKQG